MGELFQIPASSVPRVPKGEHVRELFGDLEGFGAAVRKYARAAHCSHAVASRRAVAVAVVIARRDAPRRGKV